MKTDKGIPETLVSFDVYRWIFSKEQWHGRDFALASL